MKTSDKNTTFNLQSFKILEEDLGRRLSTKEVASFLDLDEDTVRKYYETFGGIRPTGPNGRILFFEKNIVSALSRRTEYAFEHNEEWTNSMEGKGAKARGNQTETSQVQEGGAGLGSSRKKKGLVGDRHNLFNS